MRSDLLGTPGSDFRSNVVLWWIRNTDLDLIIQIGGITGVERQVRLLAYILTQTPPLPPHCHLHHHPCSAPLPPPHSLYWPRDPLPHITYGSSVRRKGDLTANLAWDGPWRWGPSTSQRIPIFSWLPPSSPLFSLLLPTPPFLFLFFFLLIIGAGEHVRQESADEEQGRQTLSVHDLVDTCRMICGGRK